MNSWERYLARSFELRMEYASEEARIRRCWLRYYKQTLLLESLPAPVEAEEPKALK